MTDPETNNVRIPVEVEESDDYPEVLHYDLGDGPQKLYSAPSLNRTPVQSAQILRLRTLLGSGIDFVADSDRLMARATFDSLGDAIVTYYDHRGEEAWTDTIKAEHTVPDTPMPVGVKKGQYRWLALGIPLFLFIAIEFIFLLPSAHANVTFIARATIGLFLAVFASVIVLRLARRWMGM